MVDRATRALASASASLVVPHDISGALAGMLTGMGSALDIDACGMLAADRDGRFEVLSVSSHDPADLGLFESQTVDGPGVAACRLNAALAISGRDDVRRRWPDLAGAMEVSGHGSLLASPMRWNGEALGANVVFRRGDESFTEAERLTMQAFADLSMLVIVHSDQVTVRTAALRVDEALQTRVLIEQAKGVLAYQRRISMAEAYESLQRISREAGIPLTAGAKYVVSMATDA